MQVRNQPFTPHSGAKIGPPTKANASDATSNPDDTDAASTQVQAAPPKPGHDEIDMHPRENASRQQLKDLLHPVVPRDSGSDEPGKAGFGPDRLDQFLRQRGAQATTHQAQGSTPSAQPTAKDMQDAFKMVKGQGFDSTSMDSFVYVHFGSAPNAYMKGMPASDFNKLISKASEKTYGEIAQDHARANPKRSSPIVNKMADAIANKGSAPATWSLAMKLNADSWRTLMHSYNEMSPASRQAFASAFGSPKLSGARRLQDGVAKLGAITMQKSIEAKALGKTEMTSDFGDILGKISSMPGMPPFMSKVLDGYATVLNELPQDYAKGLSRETSVRALALKLADEIGDRTGNHPGMDTVLKTLRHFQEVAQYRSTEKTYTAPDRGDHVGFDKVNE